MIVRPWLFVFFLVIFIPLGTAAVAAEYRVPLMDKAPKIDGVIDESAWANALQLDGFTEAGSKKVLERRRASAYIGATESHIYVAVKTQLPEEGALIAATTPGKPPVGVIHDDSLEIWVDPDIAGSHGRLFQMAVIEQCVI
jgi:hypothetical protein